MAKSPRSKAKTRPKTRSRSTRKHALREVDGVFVDREHLDQVLSALVQAGFRYTDMTAVLEGYVEGGRRVAVTDVPRNDFTPTDKRQVRTLGTSLAGAIAALAALGVTTVATGGAGALAVTAAALAGGSAATGVHVIKTMSGFDGASEDIVLSVRAKKPADEKHIADIFEQHGAKQIWVQNRQISGNENELAS